MPNTQRNSSFIIVILALLAVAAHARPQGREDLDKRRRTPIVEAVQKVMPSVVSINTQAAVTRRRTPWDELFNYEEGNDSDGAKFRDVGLGSGVIVDPKGYVITNDHVVGRASRIIVKLADGRELEAKLIGDDADNDIAVLKIVSDEKFVPIELAPSNDLLLGEQTIALGSPFGLSGSVTSGILSATNRPITFRGREVFSDFLQTSAVINPGNSGGPLVNINGQLIGINVAIHSRGPGIGFAIPVARVREVLYRLLDPRFTKKAWLGFDVDHHAETTGARISAIDDDSPADAAGLDADDVVLAVNGKYVSDWIDFKTTLDGFDPGATLELTIARKGEHLAKKLRLEPAPASPKERAVFDLVGFEFDDVPDALRVQYGLNGVVVRSVAKGSPAEEKRLEVNDIIYNIGGYNVKDKAAALAIVQAMAQRRNILDVRVIREGRKYQGSIPFTR